MPTVLLIRHAQASYGEADYDMLSERGQDQVEALRRSLARCGVMPARVASGQLRRQRDTVAPWADGAGPVVDPRWNEYNDDDVLAHHSESTARVHRASGDAGPALTSREFQVVADQALADWVAAGARSPCAEPWPEFQARVRAALGTVADSLAAGETALVASSSGVISALAASLIGAPEAAFVAMNRISINTAVTKIIVGSRGRTLVSYNDHAHLEEAGNGLLTYR
jgi:broad specificity phosphatase PhoE